MGKHNHKAIFMAVVVQQALGYVWYSPSMFGVKWASATGKYVDSSAAMQVLPCLAALMASAFFCYLLSWLFQLAVIEDWKDGLATGLLVGVGFIAPALTAHDMFLSIHANIILIDVGKEIIGSGLAGIILATWRAVRTPDDPQKI